MSAPQGTLLPNSRVLKRGDIVLRLYRTGIMVTAFQDDAGRIWISCGSRSTYMATVDDKVIGRRFRTPERALIAVDQFLKGKRKAIL